MQLTVALGQIALVLGDREANLATVRQIAARAEMVGADLLVLPELWGTGYMLEQAHTLSDPLGKGLFEEVAILAARHHLAIIGSLLERDGKQVYNTATLYDAQGKRLHSYRKTHLIGLMQEDQYLGAGQQAEIFDTAWGKSACAICYDLRFPELFRRYALAGAGVIIIPAEWPTVRIEHWRTLLRARAIENQAVVIACNRVGSDRANQFGGHSVVIDPWGNVLVEGDDQSGLLTASVDLDSVAKARDFLPVFRDRRVDLY
ncbi:carbon-nitrogen family hydrolase [Herpetosiphon gulosus]|uniref:Omega-amidase YafV n=1 Tax=Herpetosiphon gulosus TaxID=1973496 RepID=A0ABP9WXJ1_9CHLR